MKKWIYFVMLLPAFLFVSCDETNGNDDDDGDGTSDPNPTEQTRLITGITERVKLTHPREYTPLECEFKYDSQTSELKELHISNSTFTYSYGILGEIRLTEDEYNSQVATLNAKGYISQVKDDYYTYLYNYNNDDYLTAVKEKYDYGDSYERCSYIWNDGNLTEKGNYEDSSSKWSESYVYSSDLNNKANLDLNVFFFDLLEYSTDGFHYDSYNYEYTPDLFALINKAGKRSKNYIINTGEKDENMNEYLNFLYTESTEPAIGIIGTYYDAQLSGNGKYTFDAEGYPVSFVWQSKVTKTERIYNGEKEYQTPKNEYERREWEERFGTGPWFYIKTTNQHSTWNDTHTFNITYKQ